MSFCCNYLLIFLFVIHYVFFGQFSKLLAGRVCVFPSGGVYLSKIIQSKARLFTRNIREPGAAFEYVLFINKEQQRCVCIFQAGHLLEGPPGWDLLPLVFKLYSEAAKNKYNHEESRLMTLLNFGLRVSRNVHGGAIATMIDTVTGTHASLLSEPVMTANLSINYRRYNSLFLSTCKS